MGVGCSSVEPKSWNVSELKSALAKQAYYRNAPRPPAEVEGGESKCREDLERGCVHAQEALHSILQKHVAQIDAALGDQIVEALVVVVAMVESDEERNAREAKGAMEASTSRAITDFDLFAEVHVAQPEDHDPAADRSNDLRPSEIVVRSPSKSRTFMVAEERRERRTSFASESIRAVESVLPLGISSCDVDAESVTGVESLHYRRTQDGKQVVTVLLPVGDVPEAKADAAGEQAVDHEGAQLGEEGVHSIMPANPKLVLHSQWLVVYSRARSVAGGPCLPPPAGLWRERLYPVVMSINRHLVYLRG